MPLVFAGITPHPPFLIPSISQKRPDMLQSTKAALAEMEQELYLTKPHVIMIISPHVGLFENTFTINAHTTFHTDFKEFGDMSTPVEWKGAPDMAAKLSHKAKTSHVPLRLLSNEILDHGSAIPLLFIAPHLADVKILPIGFSNASQKDHHHFGEILKEVISETDKRIAVIASGDLTHQEGQTASEKIFPFDATLITLLEQGKQNEIQNLDQTLVEKAQECGYRSILVILGILKDMRHSFRKLSYEAPFGVGYLTGIFEL